MSCAGFVASLSATPPAITSDQEQEEGEGEREGEGEEEGKERETGILEFSLAFESGSASTSSDPDTELANGEGSTSGGEGRESRSIRVDRPNQTPSSSVVASSELETETDTCCEEVVGKKVLLEPRRISLDELSSSIQDGTVVTQAIVTIA